MYQNTKNGKYEYIGRTNNFNRRKNEHKNTRDIEVYEYKEDGIVRYKLDNLTYEQARAAKDLLIRNSGLENLSNIRNGMSDAKRKSPKYATALKEMCELLGLPKEL